MKPVTTFEDDGGGPFRAQTDGADVLRLVQNLKKVHPRRPDVTQRSDNPFHSISESPQPTGKHSQEQKGK